MKINDKYQIFLCQLKILKYFSHLVYELDKKFPWEDQQMEFKMEEGIHTLKVFKGDSLIDEIELEVIQPLEYFFEFSKIVE